MAQPRPRMRAGPARQTGLPHFAGGKPPGRSLERRSNAPPRGMIVHDRIRLTGRLRIWPRISCRSCGASGSRSLCRNRRNPALAGEPDFPCFIVLGEPQAHEPSGQQTDRRLHSEAPHMLTFGGPLLWDSSKPSK